MSLTGLAGVGGLGFVVIAIGVNAAYVRAKLPMPVSHRGLDAAVKDFAAAGAALRWPSVPAPASWLLLTVFAAGLLSMTGRDGSDSDAWALVGFAGVLLQNASFACVEALRFGMASAAAHGSGAMAGLWGFSNVLFGFNQVFLATALIGFTAAGADAGLVPGWHAALGYASAALLFASASASPLSADGATRMAPVGLLGWLGWIAWIVVSSIALLAS